MSKALSLFASLLTLLPFGYAVAETTAPVKNKPTVAESTKASPFKPFTGKIIGSHVRMRISPDLDSNIISELGKDDYIVVSGEKGDFYAVQPPSEIKAFIFRGFIIDNVVEGDHVNIRLFPDRDAPIIGHYSTGKVVNGSISEKNNKWLEISAPPETQFYIAKEFIEHVGSPELKGVHDKRKATVVQLFESANFLTQSELRKPFNEIDIERITHNYETIVGDYPEFSHYVQQASKSLAQVKEDYLHKKIAFLETKASKMGHQIQMDEIKQVSYLTTESISSTDRMKIWEPIEESLYLTWSSMHHAKTMHDYYAEQKLKCRTISGILEAYKEPVKNKPGDYILKDKDTLVSFLYSTHVNLEDLVGKRVTLNVIQRPNNNFAFPAYYVLDAE